MLEGKPSYIQPIVESPFDIDDVTNMLLRRQINESFARERVDFYASSLQIGQRLMGRVLEPDNIVVDVGGSYGDMLYQGVIATGTQAQAICVDPGKDALKWYRNSLATHKKERIKFIPGQGEELSFATNSVQSVMMHNVIFRTTDPVRMLHEARRIVQPGGFIAISTNIQGHAWFRHNVEESAARLFNDTATDKVNIPKPPAAGKYFGDLPALFDEAGISVNDEDEDETEIVLQDTYAVINENRLNDYLWAIYVSIDGLGIEDASQFAKWRKAVDESAREHITCSIANDPNGEFLDPIKRGMYVFVNRKPAQG